MLTKVKKVSETTTTALLANKPSISGNNKQVKKKLCMMMMVNGGSGEEMQLKPLSTRAKREPLPMRLRALPKSYWEEPNRPNVTSLITTCLPQLFKTDMDFTGKSQIKKQANIGISM